MEKTVLTVNGMSCNHCKMAVEKGVGQINGVKAVTVDLAAATATVEYEAPATLEAIRAAIEEEGYEVA